MNRADSSPNLIPEHPRSRLLPMAQKRASEKLTAKDPHSSSRCSFMSRLLRGKLHLLQVQTFFPRRRAASRLLDRAGFCSRAPRGSGDLDDVHTEGGAIRSDRRFPREGACAIVRLNSLAAPWRASCRPRGEEAPDLLTASAESDAPEQGEILNRIGWAFRAAGLCASLPTEKLSGAFPPSNGRKINHEHGPARSSAIPILRPLI